MDGTLDSSNKWSISAGGAGKVDGSAVTQPVSASSLPLPTGAATAAKQPALGTAGSASTDVITVQGIASGTAQPVSGTVSATQSGTWTVQPGNTANTTAWKVDGSAVTQPVSGTVTANNAVTDVAPATANVTVVDSGSTSTVSANGQSLVTGTATANSTAAFSLSGIETIRIQVTGTWTGTLSSEISIDGGTTWFAVGLHQGAFTISTFTANFVGGANVAGATNFRMRGTATMTGTATVKVIESFNTSSVYIANAGPSGNYVSLLNSSTATLTSGSVFTGTAEDVTNFSEMRVSVIASHASATNGLSLQQSSDGTNWDITDTYTISATTAATYVVPRQAKWFRVVYTNGGTNQTSFRLQTILNRNATAGSSQRAQDAYSNENDLEQMWAFNSIYNGTTWDRVRGENGKTLVAQTLRASKVQQQTTITSSTSETTVLTAVASTFLDVYGVIVANTSASATTVTFKDATAGTTRFILQVPAGDTRGFMLTESAAYNQAVVNNNWTATSGTSVASLQITMFAQKN